MFPTFFVIWAYIFYLLFLRFDMLNIHDGDSSSANLIDQLWGANLPNDITSTGSNIFINFLSDESETYSGFKMKFLVG